MADTVDMIDISDRYDFKTFEFGEGWTSTSWKRDIGRHTYSFVAVCHEGHHSHVSANRIVHEEAHKISF